MNMLKTGFQACTLPGCMSSSDEIYLLLVSGLHHHKAHSRSQQHLTLFLRHTLYITPSLTHIVYVNYSGVSKVTDKNALLDPATRFRKSL